MYNATPGLAFHFAATYGASKSITSISNANPAVAAFATGHSIAVGDVFVIDTNDYEPLEEQVHRASAVASDNITLEGIDTTNTTLYPAGGGAGSAREVLTWTQIKGIIGQAIDGDEQAFETLTPLGKFGRQIKVPTDRSPTDVTLTISHNAYAQAFWIALAGLDVAKTKTVLRAVWPDGMRFFLYGYVSVQKPPKLDGNNSPKGMIKFVGTPTAFGT